LSEGFYFPWWFHLNLYLLVSMIPLWRWTQARGLANNRASTIASHKTVRYLTFLFLTTLCCASVTLALMPPKTLSSDEVSPVLIVIWVIGVLALLLIAMLILDRLLPKKKTQTVEEEVEFQP
ncbi:MAG: hypothetical protein AAF492_33680, partial [Verrucomicrobiota bacterium]